MTADANTRYDVAILGSGIGGSMLAAILAKHGVSTILLEEQTHPRFAIGESLIPETGVRLRILAEKHGIPALGWLGSFHQLRDNVSSACGVKRSFSFMYHREGERHVASETNQLPTLTPPFGPDSHLFRQDTDAYMTSVAVRLGARFRQQVRVNHIDFLEDEVRLMTASGEAIRASYLIDAGGMRSHVSTQLGLRDEVPRFRTDTRALYNHFLGVTPTDFLVNGGRHGLPSPLAQATMHHIFDGGWIWIIPFCNHRDSTNPLTSVGMMLDRSRYPTPQGAPEDEFRAIARRFPTIAKHFENATAVRPWVTTGRIQYSQKHLLGKRFLQLPHAACFVDPLYSSGLSVLTVAIDLIVERLLPAVAENDFSTERFQAVEDIVNTGFDHYDLIVSKSFDAWKSYELWNAWNRNWVLGNYMGTWGPLSMLVRYLGTKDRRFLDKTSELGRIGVLSSHIPEIRDAMRASGGDIDDALAGRVTHKEASARIFARLGALPFVPKYMGFGRVDQHAPTTFTLPMGARHVLWYRFFSDARWRDWCGFSLLTYARLALGAAFSQLREGSRRALAAFRDVFIAGNDEWRYMPNAITPRARWALAATTEPQPMPPRTQAQHLEARGVEAPPIASPSIAGSSIAESPRPSLP